MTTPRATTASKCGSQPGSGDGQFEAAGHADEGGVGPGFGGGALGSVDEPVHDLCVPGGGDDGDAQLGGVDGEFGCSGMGHGVSFALGSVEPKSFVM
jgi:hypothetical protein